MQPSAGSSKASLSLPVEDIEENETDQPASKKQKFSRSRTACLQCRSRKTKCGAHPPDPCPNCIEAKLQCTWPSEDGRSSRARMQKAQQAYLSQQMRRGQAEGQAQAQGQDQTDVHMSMPLEGQRDDGWLEGFLANGQMTDTAPGYPDPPTIGISPPPSTTSSLPLDPSSFQVLFNTLHPPEDHSFIPGAMGGKIPGFVYGQSQPGPSTPSVQTTNTNIDPLGGMGMTPNFDPAQFIWAVSNQLPQIEDSSPYDERTGTFSGGSGVSPHLGEVASRNGKGKGKGKEMDGEGSKLVKITWWRPHGATAIAPGLKKITLKVRVADTPPQWKPPSPHSNHGEFNLNTLQQVIDPNGLPNSIIMYHLLDLFFVHFGCQFPFLNRAELENQVDSGTGSAFLFHAIAGIAARFSTHPSIAVPHLEPHAYGNVFSARAKILLGSMLGVPSRETIIAFILMSHISFANDCESDLWMHTGCAVRMAYDLGLHLETEDPAEDSSEESRLNRLVFWSVLIMDHALAFGVGRQTTFRLEDITQQLPTEADIHPHGVADGTPPSAFPYAAKQMMIYGPLINMLNSNYRDRDPVRLESDIQNARAAAMVEYNQLPEDMQWNVGNLQSHNRAHRSPIFLQLHLWMHLILASAFLTGANLLRRSKPGNTSNGTKSGAATPNSATVSSVWRNSARTIGDILVLSDIINSHSYLALPFVNQAFYVAGCCYVKEIEQHHSTAPTPATSPKRVPASLSMTPHSPPTCPATEVKSASPPKRDPRQLALSRALLTSVATNNISTLQQGLAKMTTYWSGVAWVAGALTQRIQGIKAQDVDLVNVTETLGSYVSLPDAGSLPRNGDYDHREEGGRVDDAITPRTWDAFMHAAGGGSNGFGDMDFSALPFELGAIEGGLQNVTEQDVPLQSFGAEWFR